MDMTKVKAIADGVEGLSKRFDSFLKRRKDKRGDASPSKELKALQDEEEKLEAEMAKAPGDKADKLEARIRAVQIKIKKLSRDDSARGDADDLKAGDRVKVTKRGSNFEGKTGVVAGVGSGTRPITVDFKSEGGSGTFKPDEVRKDSARSDAESPEQYAQRKSEETGLPYLVLKNNKETIWIDKAGYNKNKKLFDSEGYKVLKEF